MLKETLSKMHPVLMRRAYLPTSMPCSISGPGPRSKHDTRYLAHNLKGKSGPAGCPSGLHSTREAHLELAALLVEGKAAALELLI